MFLTILDDYSCILSMKRTKNVSFESKRVNLKGEGCVCVVYQKDGDCKPSPPFRPKKVRTGISTHVLQSNLQKAVRRREKEVILSSAWSLLANDRNSFLRRWPIIMIEDALPHPKLLSIIWLMGAVSKGYALTEDDARFLMGTVVDTVYHPFRDLLTKQSLPSFRQWKDYCEVGKAMMLRARYGGMAGDMRMCAGMASLWTERLKKDPDLLNSLVPHRETTLRFPIPFRACHVLPASKDFHCTSVLNPLTKKRKFSEESLRKAMWFHSSSISVRVFAFPSPETDAFEEDLAKKRKRSEDVWSWVRDELEI